MFVEISDTHLGTKYTAAFESECNDASDRTVYREVCKCEQVVTMGKIIGRPVPAPMSPSGPSKGPFTLTTPYINACAQIIDAEGEPIGHALPVGMAGRRDSNARLFGAAPELLDACIGLLALVQMHVPNNSAQVQDAIRAISKTEGK